MISKEIARLQNILTETLPLLQKMSLAEFSTKATPDSWSKQEILGHLIDSATNNHQRFIRSQYEETPSIVYEQNYWNEYNYYNKAIAQDLVELWHSYNKQLALLIEHFSEKQLMEKCNTGGTQNYSVKFLFVDYIAHLEHHLKQIVTYK